MLYDPTFWVAIAFVLFVAAVFKPARAAILGGLDAKIAEIRQQVDEAERLRNEAQDLLDTYRRQQRQALQDAEDMVARSREDSERQRKEGAQELIVALERQRQMSLDKIAQAEAAALQEVRARAVDIAIAATEKILSDRLDGDAGDRLVEASIRDLPAKLQ